MGYKPIIDEEKCEGCGLCANICRCGALVIVGNKVRAVEVNICGWCTLCELVCPNGAITCPFEVVFETENNTCQ